MKSLVLIAVLSVTAMAQTPEAKVIELSQEDMVEASQLHDEELALRAKQQRFHDHIVQKYLINTTKDNTIYQPPSYGSSCIDPCKDTYELKEGWSSEFLYSQDFKFIVPKDVMQHEIQPLYTTPGEAKLVGLDDEPIVIAKTPVLHRR